MEFAILAWDPGELFRERGQVGQKCPEAADRPVVVGAFGSGPWRSQLENLVSALPRIPAVLGLFPSRASGSFRAWKTAASQTPDSFPDTLGFGLY